MVFWRLEAGEDVMVDGRLQSGDRWFGCRKIDLIVLGKGSRWYGRRSINWLGFG